MAEIHIFTSPGGARGKSSMALCATAFFSRISPNGLIEKRLMIFDANRVNPNLATEWLKRFRGSLPIGYEQVNNPGQETWLDFFSICEEQVCIVWYDKDRQQEINSVTSAPVHPLNLVSMLRNDQRLGDFSPHMAKRILIDTNTDILEFLRGIDEELYFKDDTCYVWIMWSPNSLTAVEPATYLSDAQTAIKVLEEKYGSVMALHVFNPLLAYSDIGVVSSQPKRNFFEWLLGQESNSASLSRYNIIDSYNQYKNMDTGHPISIEDFVRTLQEHPLGNGLWEVNKDHIAQHEVIGEYLCNRFVETDDGDKKRRQNIFAIPHFDIKFAQIREFPQEMHRLYTEAVAANKPGCSLSGLAESDVMGEVYLDVEYYLTELSAVLY